jgi:DNA polymerase III delta prime subunit
MNIINKSMNIPIDAILEREHIANEIAQLLSKFDENCNNLNYKKGIYIYGSPGCGKTQFVTTLLKTLNYDMVKYDAGDIRNKSLIDTITCNNISQCNVLNMMQGINKKIAIVMDEIDGMNNGDKGGITSLIKLIRQKKTKKQKTEHKTLNPIICIGNYYIDKKIKELMKVCNTFELKTPTELQIKRILGHIIPIQLEVRLEDRILMYVQGDLRKLEFIKKLYNKKSELMNYETLTNIFQVKSYNDDAKKITQTLINTHIPIEKYNSFMNETDRTIVALLWHENIVDVIEKLPKSKTIPFYLDILDNICFADYIDRITFQNQIWQFNEMSSLIKTFYNNSIYHNRFREHVATHKLSDVRFTKVLTKYSTEYNNILFITNLCQELDMDKKDLVAFFQEMRLYYDTDFMQRPDIMSKVDECFENTNINKLDIRRMYRYLDKNVKKDATVTLDNDSDSDCDCDI